MRFRIIFILSIFLSFMFINAVGADSTTEQVEFEDDFMTTTLNSRVWKASGNGSLTFGFLYKGIITIKTRSRGGSSHEISTPIPNGISLWGIRGEKLVFIDGWGSMGLGQGQNADRNVTIEMGIADGKTLVAGFFYSARSTPSTWSCVSREGGSRSGEQTVTNTMLNHTPGNRTWMIEFLSRGTPGNPDCLAIRFVVNGNEVATHTVDSFAPHGLIFRIRTSNYEYKQLSLDFVEWSIKR